MYTPPLTLQADGTGQTATIPNNKSESLNYVLPSSLCPLDHLYSSYSVRLFPFNTVAHYGPSPDEVPVIN
ncbi:hypothetical protein JTE90_019189 [Oedothorax gibbosus]|uniref:Uncharacterized protein n=1 Tax=Oedothorax gibbosus TaxID=931172 RepID=A0AAV6U6C7_9ARAC|nr:hypothetical protein JTE90_019189 [Oedothorax gibbosus]